MSKEIFVPKLGVNDDDLLISEIHVSNLEFVEEGRLLFVLESMKTSEEVFSTSNGYVFFEKSIGQYVKVGSLLCSISDNLDESNIIKSDSVINDQDLNSFVITSKAQILLDEYNIEPRLLGLELIKESDVMSYVERMNVAIENNYFDSLKFQNNSLVLIGASSFASSIISTLNRLGVYSIMGLLVSKNDKHLVGQTYNGVQIIGTDDMASLNKLYNLGLRNIFLAYGSFFALSGRLKKCKEIIKIGYDLPVIIHPNSIIGDYVNIGSGSYIGPLANIGNNVNIGVSSIILDSVIVAHDSKIGDNVYLSPGCILAGGVEVGSSTIIGMGVTIYLKVNIGNNVVVNNGINVYENISSNSLVKK